MRMGREMDAVKASLFEESFQKFPRVPLFAVAVLPFQVFIARDQADRPVVNPAVEPRIVDPHGKDILLSELQESTGMYKRGAERTHPMS